MRPNIYGWLDVNNRSLQTTHAWVRWWPFLAGATNAGDFLAVGTYISHMTGVASALADHLVLGNLVLAVASLAALLAFLLGCHDDCLAGQLRAACKVSADCWSLMFLARLSVAG